jgi:hypothetical protein
MNRKWSGWNLSIQSVCLPLMHGLLSHTMKEGPTMAEHLREVSRQVRPPDPDDGG